MPQSRVMACASLPGPAGSTAITRPGAMTVCGAAGHSAGATVTPTAAPGSGSNEPTTEGGSSSSASQRGRRAPSSGPWLTPGRGSGGAGHDVRLRVSRGRTFGRRSGFHRAVPSRESWDDRPLGHSPGTAPPVALREMLSVRSGCSGPRRSGWVSRPAVSSPSLSDPSVPPAPPPAPPSAGCPRASVRRLRGSGARSIPR